MKQIKTKSGKIICVEVPEESFNFTIYDNGVYFEPRLPEYLQFQSVNFKTYDLKLKILGKLSELTDKGCEEFVEFNFPFDGQSIKIYKNYYYVPLEPWDTTPWYKSAKESFLSLLESEGVDTSNEDKLLIIKVL